MVDELVDQNSGKRFPFINLEKALDRATKIYEADRNGRAMAVTVAFEIWEYSDKSSGGHQTIAALKSYGIIEAEREDEARKVGLTTDALRYFKDERDEPRAALRKTFALRPPLLASLWEVWGDAPPADNVARSHLKVDRGLGEQQARALLSLYKENLAFADLKRGDKVSEEPKEQLSKQTSTNPFQGLFREPPKRETVKLAESERELTTGLLAKDASFRLIVSGRIGAKEIDMLIAKLQLDRDILAEPESETGPHPEKKQPPPDR